jgi:Fe-S-cluster-containing dehydrogenase component
VVVDYDWCIGCRYCQAACPYWARRFNYTQPTIPPGQLNSNMGYLSNRPRTKGVMEKCTFCLHRTREGRLPACLEACPTGARKFGNIMDPESEVARILRTKRIFVLKEEANTMPRFFYYFDERTPRPRMPDNRLGAGTAGSSSYPPPSPPQSLTVSARAKKSIDAAIDAAMTSRTAGGLA